MHAEGEMVASTNPLPEGVHVLTFRELTKTFGQTVAVDHVSFDVRSGEIHARGWQIDPHPHARRGLLA